MGLIKETNQQYYEGAQGFIADGTSVSFTTSFNTNLVLGSFDPLDVNYSLNNFKLYTSTTGLPETYTEYVTAFTVVSDVITFPVAPVDGLYIVVQLKTLTGGKYGQTLDEQAFGQAVEDNYGNYQYIKLHDAIDNFMVGYVGEGKILQRAKKSDVLFFAKRAVQEFSYDTLKSIKSAELSVPPSLTLVIPQDYVNYVKCSFVDHLGVLHPIYPTNNLTTSPYYTQIQDNTGIPTQDNFGENIEGTSLTQEKWHAAGGQLLDAVLTNNREGWYYDWNENGVWTYQNWGQLYGLEPQLAQTNGWFNINEREGKLSFSSDLVGKLIILEYISDGLAFDADTKIPKLAEDALYASILHSITSTRAGQQEYVVQRLQKAVSYTHLRAHET